MDKEINQKLIHLLNDHIEPFSQQGENYSSLLNKIGNARFVLIGEATHGTHEFYQTRAEITKQLILQKGFMAVAIEGDWPDAYRIHRYLQGKGNKENIDAALSDFKRFPTWMWRNQTLVPFLKWLRTHNDNLPSLKKMGFYGLDLYSLNSSMQAVIDYLSKVDPEEAQRARQRYACFDHLGFDPQTYGYLTTEGLKKPCLKEATEQLLELQHHAFDYARKDNMSERDEFFFAAQNARLVKDAEVYYRSMFEGRVSSWNIRDTHMLETLNVLADHLESHFNQPAKIVIWAHNSHVGDARATEMGEKGEVNIGQLVREHHGVENTFSIGFSTYQGYVTAANDWGDPAQHKRVNPGIAGSYEELFHHLKYPNFLLDLDINDQLEHYLNIPRLQRAIGVIYRPDTERYSHYFFTRLPYQFDCIIHFDQTTALQPLDINPEWKL